ncbi:MAG: hypothetical protein NTW74_10455 [Acidobacteria bacterium]|nr:hypothetical protein [Acidobacteriota bacterium]
MSEPLDLVRVNVPARIAQLDFSISLPRDWNVIDLPEEEVDFSAPEKFFPLMIAATPWAAVMMSVAARPGFEDGSLQDWSLFLLNSQGIRPTAFMPSTIGNVQGLVGTGQQEQEGTLLEFRFAFFEDGGRLVYLGLLAPEAISASMEPVWKAAIDGFVLETVQGQNVPIGPGAGISPPPPTETSPEAPPAKPFTDEDMGFYAKSDEATTLDPEHPVNARLRDQGVGFVPNIIELDAEAKTAKLGVAAIRALIQVALGWHVIDDGKRTMVLDPDGKIQINLSIIPKHGRSIDQILDEFQSEAEQSYPEPEFIRFANDGISALAVRNIAVNDEPIEQIHMMVDWADDSAMLRARVTSDPPSMRFAVDYADRILKSVSFES